ncbi:MAG: tryptophan-rich sensory protein [Lachnospiraceae bacterium]|nr:tryptophan-rich sensory protein [Lachnospiraceae bacterium]
MKMKNSIIPIIICIAIPLVVGFVSSYITRGAMSTFQTLYKPKLAPPGWLFPVAWTILYVLMGLASYMLYRSDHSLKAYALCIYAIQLFFNFCWSIIFFNREMYWFALVWLLTMWVIIIALIVVSARISFVAMLLLIPLFLWTTFAAYLNFSIARLN